MQMDSLDKRFHNVTHRISFPPNILRSKLDIIYGTFICEINNIINQRFKLIEDLNYGCKERNGGKYI